MSDRNGQKDWVDRQLENPEFRVGFEQELASQRFGDELESALEREGLTRSDVAKRLGTSRSAITQALRRGRNLTIKKMVELASACGCEIWIELRRKEEQKTAVYSKLDRPSLAFWTSELPSEGLMGDYRVTDQRHGGIAHQNREGDPGYAISA